MKRPLIALLAMLSFAAPLAFATASADDDDRRRRHHDRYDRYERSERHDRRDRNWDDDDDRRGERRAYRHGYRDGRHYDRDRHNGYYVGRSWYYGPPPSAYYTRHDYHPGYRAWRRGDHLPRFYRERCRPVDWRRYDLSAPPRGYHWVRDDRGDYLLIGIATGVILGLALGH